jgi:hypothetical protein
MAAIFMAMRQPEQSDAQSKSYGDGKAWGPEDGSSDSLCAE